MDKIFKNFGSPIYWLASKAGLGILLGLISSSFTYYTLKINRFDFSEQILYFLSINNNLLIKLTIFVLYSSLYTFFLNTKYLKKINTKLINLIACVIVFCILLLANTFLAWFVVIIALIMALWKGYRGDEFTYEYTFNPYGNSKWANIHDLNKAQLVLNKKQYSFILGKLIGTDDFPLKKGEHYLGFSGEGHVLTVAKTGAGKGVGVVIPNLLHYKGSSIVIDPKGENFIATHYHRESVFNNEILLIDPFKEVSRQLLTKCEALKEEDISSGFSRNESKIKYYTDLYKMTSAYDKHTYLSGLNPMQLINYMYDNKQYDDIYDEASVLADLIVVRSVASKDPHWDEKAKSLIRGAILYVIFADEYAGGHKNLSDVRQCILSNFNAEEKPNKLPLNFEEESIKSLDLLDLSDLITPNLTKFQIFIEKCSDTSKFYHIYLKGIVGELSMIAGEERNSVLSSVLRHTDFIESPKVHFSLSNGKCDLLNIKRHHKTIYLVLPPNKLNTYSRLMRVWIGTAIQSIANDPHVSANRVLLMLDEMAQLGYMDPIVQSVSLLRGYGMNLWMIFQDISQIKSIYGDKWQTFLANAKIQQYFGISEVDTAEYISKLLGQTTMTLRTDTGSNSSDERGNNTSTSNSQTISFAGKPLLYPDQIMRVDYQMLIAENCFPIKASKLKYFDDPDLSDIQLYPSK